MNIRPWNEKYWFSPCYVIKEWARQKKAGNKKIKKYEEAWVCAVALICSQKDTQNEWWIQVPQQTNSTPDVVGMTIIPNSDGIGQDLAFNDFEIFEISEFDNEESIEASIERKIYNKDYANIILIGFVRRNVVFDYVRVSEYIQSLKPKAMGILLLVSETANTNFGIIGIYPEPFKLKESNFGLYCNNSTQKDFTEMIRGTKISNIDNNTDDFLTLVP